MKTRNSLFSALKQSLPLSQFSVHEQAEGKQRYSNQAEAKCKQKRKKSLSTYLPLYTFLSVLSLSSQVKLLDEVVVAQLLT